MLHIGLFWDENGRNVVLSREAGTSRVWPVRLYALGSAQVEETALSPDLVDQLETFGSAELPAVDEAAIVSRLKPVGRLAA